MRMREIEQKGEGNVQSREIFFVPFFSLYQSLEHVYVFIGKLCTDIEADRTGGEWPWEDWTMTDGVPNWGLQSISSVELHLREKGYFFH